jgi:RNA polymerase sigma factor (sigma-70 family)
LNSLPTSSQEPEAGPPWASHLGRLCRELPLARTETESDRIRSEIWLLLNTALRKYLRMHAQRRGAIPREEEEDLASERSLDLLRRIVSGLWEPATLPPAQIAGYLSVVARNSIINSLSRSRRSESLGEVWDLPGERQPMARLDAHRPQGADAGLSRRDFAEALHHCLTRLAPRARTAWMLRAFCGLGSREIASHPEVLVQSGHVDVLLYRARQTLRQCMGKRGQNSEEIPPGTFAHLWRVLPMEQILHG